MQAVGYLCATPFGDKGTQKKIMSESAVAGLGAFCGQVSFPALVFRAIAILNFSTVEYTVCAALVFGKLLLVGVSVALGRITSDDSKGFEALAGGARQAAAWNIAIACVPLAHRLAVAFLPLRVLCAAHHQFRRSRPGLTRARSHLPP